MTTKTMYVSGTCKWARVRTPDEKYGNYSINLYPDKGSLNAIQESGIQLAPKTDEDGIFYKFRRDHQKIIKKELVEFGPPTILNPDETLFEGLIGNGSEVTLNVSVFDTQKGKGHRLNKVRVDKLVTYVPENKEEGSAPAAVTNSGARPF